MHKKILKYIYVFLLTFTSRGNVNAPGLILSTDQKSKPRTHAVFVMEPNNDDIDFSMQDLSIDNSAGDKITENARCLSMLGVGRLACSSGSSSKHTIINIKDEDIMHITSATVKVDTDKVVNDVKKREIPRFRSDPPGQSVMTAMEALIKLIDPAAKKLEILSPRRDFKIQELELILKLQKLEELTTELNSMEARQEFTQLFYKVYAVKSRQEELDRCNYLCSEASLTLLPEYHCRIDVLRTLQYIDVHNTVQLKVGKFY